MRTPLSSPSAFSAVPYTSELDTILGSMHAGMLGVAFAHSVKGKGSRKREGNRTHVEIQSIIFS